jgi:hypothetical protein
VYGSPAVLASPATPAGTPLAAAAATRSPSALQRALLMQLDELQRETEALKLRLL